MKAKSIQSNILFFILLFTTFVSAQGTFIETSKTKDFIFEVYQDVISDLSYDKPEQIQRFKNIVKRFEIIFSKDTPENYRYLSEVPLINLYNKELALDLPFDPQDFNPLKYKFDISSIHKTVYYLVDNTDYIIVIHPE